MFYIFTFSSSFIEKVKEKNEINSHDTFYVAILKYHSGCYQYTDINERSYFLYCLKFMVYFTLTAHISLD